MQLLPEMKILRNEFYGLTFLSLKRGTQNTPSSSALDLHTAES
jgi:hypothetical protein